MDPIMMTTMAALMGTLLITLYITPVVYTYLDAWQKQLARRRASDPREYPEPGAGEPRTAEVPG